MYLDHTFARPNFRSANWLSESQVKKWSHPLYIIVLATMDVIRRRKLVLFGHIGRMRDDRLVKTVLLGSVDGIRQRGRPPTKWTDNIHGLDWTVTVWSSSAVTRPCFMEQDCIWPPTVSDQGTRRRRRLRMCVCECECECEYWIYIVQYHEASLLR